MIVHSLYKPYFGFCQSRPPPPHTIINHLFFVTTQLATTILPFHLIKNIDIGSITACAEEVRFWVWGTREGEEEEERTQGLRGGGGLMVSMKGYLLLLTSQIPSPGSCQTSSSPPPSPTLVPTAAAAATPLLQSVPLGMLWWGGGVAKRKLVVSLGKVLAIISERLFDVVKVLVQT